MSKDVYYIKLDTNAFNDLKVKAIRVEFGNMLGFGRYIYLAIMLREQDGCCMPYDDLTWKVLSNDMDGTPDEIKEFVDFCINVELLQLVEGEFFSERLSRDKQVLDEKRERHAHAGRLGVEARKIKLKPVKVLKESVEQYTDKQRQQWINDGYPGETFDFELEKFWLYWNEGNRQLKNPKLALIQWMKKAQVKPIAKLIPDIKVRVES